MAKSKWRVGFLHLGPTPGGIFRTVEDVSEGAAIASARAKFMTDFNDADWFVIADRVPVEPGSGEVPR